MATIKDRTTRLNLLSNLHCASILLFLLFFNPSYDITFTFIKVEPFVFRKQGTFYGYIPDVLEQAGRMLNATFQISVTPDYKYGSFLDDGNWTGMIGDLVGNVSEPLLLGIQFIKIDIYEACSKIFETLYFILNTMT